MVVDLQDPFTTAASLIGTETFFKGYMVKHKEQALQIIAV